MKNFVAYKLREGEGFDLLNNLDGIILERLFQVCGSMQVASTGFAPNVFGETSTEIPEGVVITVRRQEKKPKASHVKHLVNKMAEQLFKDTGVKANSKSLQGYKDEAFMQVLPSTFPDDPVDTQVIFGNDGYLYLDTSYKKAEEVCSFIRDLLGSLPVEMVDCSLAPLVMKEWVANKIVEPFTLGSKIGMTDRDGRKITITKGSLYGSDAETLAEESSVVELGLEYDQVLSLVVKDDLSITGIRFDSSALAETAEDRAGSFLIMFRDLKRAYHKLRENFKGE